jgi:hypothetical protein
MAVVMINEHGQGSLEMRGADDQEPVETLGPGGPHEAFGDPVRLWRLNGCADDPGALRFEHRIKAGRELPITVANEKADRLRSVGERPRDLPRLLRDPFGVRVGRAAGEVDGDSRVR